jgi:putative sterol carrier protein
MEAAAVSEFTFTDAESTDPQQFAQWVKSASSSQLAEVMSSDKRDKVLDAIFARMPAQFRPDKAGGANAVIHWNITGKPDGGSNAYELVIADGACTLSPEPTNEPRVALTVGGPDFLNLISGNGNPMMMFMTGKLKAKGDIGLAANLGNWFALPKA